VEALSSRVERASTVADDDVPNALREQDLRAGHARRSRADDHHIPVFHDDQHGTAIVVLAALLNALRIVGKRPKDVTVDPHPSSSRTARTTASAWAESTQATVTSRTT
jgi:hypothetical protein